LARNDGEVVDGHLRLKAARKLGIAEIPVILCDDWTDAQVKAFRLAGEPACELGQLGQQLLSLELLDLKGLDFDLSLTGFDLSEIEAYMASTGPAHGLTGEDDVPEPPELPVSAAGDLWLLGDHRLLCGDATATADTTKLMAGQAADLVFSDPPYNCAYEGYTKDKLTIQGDRMSDADFKQFLEMAFRSFRSVSKPGASLYICHPSSFQREFQNAMEGAGFGVRCQIIWAKNTFAWGFGRYTFQHEPLFYCHVARRIRGMATSRNPPFGKSGIS
jgi:hypothetical protein